MDYNQNLLGIITDDDLRQNIDKNLKTLKATDKMTKSTKSVTQNILASEALFIMNNKSITALRSLKITK